MPIGEKIQALRTMKSWSQDDLARKLGTKAPNISRWENNRGTPSAEALRELAKIFDVSADYLLFDETPLTPGGLQGRRAPRSVHPDRPARRNGPCGPEARDQGHGGRAPDQGDGTGECLTGHITFGMVEPDMLY